MHEKQTATPSYVGLLGERERLRDENATLHALVAQQAALIE
jgi:hypothetical protein